MDDFPPANRSGQSSDEFDTAVETDGAAKANGLAPIFRALLRGVGENPDRDGLAGTPERAARAFEFLTQGYQQELGALLNGAIFDSPNRDMVMVRDIEFHSLCEHHLLPFFGRVHVAYLPSGKVIGLSKIPRIVDMFARRLQIQENLTDQIARSLQSAIQPRGVAIVVEARHSCMSMRGVGKQNAAMLTTTMLGLFREDESMRNQFLRLLPNPN